MRDLFLRITLMRLSIISLAVIISFTSIPVSIFATPDLEVPSRECFFLHDYMRRDFNNQTIEVLKLQAFLINFEGHSSVSLTGVFDQATFDAVSVFQMKYFKDILEPWGYTSPTGYVYILTLKKINEIYCQGIFPLNQAQINEIATFRTLNIQLPSSPNIPSSTTTISTTTTSPLPIVGEIKRSQGQILSLATAVFAQQDTLLDMVKCLYEWLLVLIVLYILGNVLKDVLYKNTPESYCKRFLAKWITINVGIVLAIIIAYILEWWCLILPLLTALIFSLFWILSYSKHNSMRASVKSWYLVVSARIRTILKKGSGKKTVAVILKEIESSKESLPKK